MKKMSLRGIKIDNYKAKVLSTCAHNISELDIASCQLSSNGIKEISAAIKLLSKPVKIKE